MRVEIPGPKTGRKPDLFSHLGANLTGARAHVLSHTAADDITLLQCMTDLASPVFFANPASSSANPAFNSCFTARVERAWPESAHDEYFVPQTPKSLTVLDSRYVPYKNWTQKTDSRHKIQSHADDALTQMPSL
jgi:hypothetical protein